MGKRLKNELVRKLIPVSGFTLIEILIALALLAFAGTFVGMKALEALHEGRVNAAKIQISNFEASLDDFARDNGQYPTTTEGLEALISNPGDYKNYRDGGYIKKDEIPLDPWGSEYTYVCSDGMKYKITSLGADREEGGEGKGADISNVK